MNRAAVAIPEKLFFKIGEVCELTGVQAHVLRYWESEFPMLAPQKNRAGQRTYRKRDVEMALRIKELLYDDQYTIAGAKKKLSGELRGASKLKVVPPETSASQPTSPQAVPTLAPTEATHAPTAAPEARAPYERQAATASPDMTEDQRANMRRLALQLRELLTILDAGDAPNRPQGK
ncbi:MAG TPA: MerR family transcriptional regulator [Pyrinomonadaceae bacterium]|nr:MerR family transcriptional regulator [Pyrinomonadaceae bacterium]